MCKAKLVVTEKLNYSAKVTDGHLPRQRCCKCGIEHGKLCQLRAHPSQLFLGNDHSEDFTIITVFYGLNDVFAVLIVEVYAIAGHNIALRTFRLALTFKYKIREGGR